LPYYSADYTLNRIPGLACNVMLGRRHSGRFQRRATDLVRLHGPSDVAFVLPSRAIRIGHLSAPRRIQAMQNALHQHDRCHLFDRRRHWVHVAVASAVPVQSSSVGNIRETAQRSAASKFPPVLLSLHLANSRRTIARSVPFTAAGYYARPQSPGVEHGKRNPLDFLERWSLFWPSTAAQASPTPNPNGCPAGQLTYGRVCYETIPNAASLSVKSVLRYNHSPFRRRTAKCSDSLRILSPHHALQHSSLLPSAGGIRPISLIPRRVVSCRGTGPTHNHHHSPSSR